MMTARFQCDVKHGIFRMLTSHPQCMHLGMWFTRFYVSAHPHDCSVPDDNGSHYRIGTGLSSCRPRQVQCQRHIRQVIS